MNRKIVAAVALVFALSLGLTENAHAHRRGGGGALAALAIGGLIAASSSHHHCGRSYYDPYDSGAYYQPTYYPPAYTTYDSYSSPYAAAPVAYAPYGYGSYGGCGSYGGYAPYGYGYRRHRSSVIPALIGAGIAYSILRHR